MANYHENTQLVKAYRSRRFTGRYAGQSRLFHAIIWSEKDNAHLMAVEDDFNSLFKPSIRDFEIEDLAPLPADNYAIICDNYGHYFSGIVNGIEGKFYPAEHANFGRGYMMQEVDGKLDGVVSESSIQNLQVLAERRSNTEVGDVVSLATLLKRRVNDPQPEAR